MATTRTRKVRVGFRPDIAVAFRGEGDITAQGNRRHKTPLQRAQKELSDALEKHNVSDIRRREIIAEASRLDTVTTMNMVTLAAVMVYLRENQHIEEGQPIIYPEDFTDEILAPYLDRLMQDFITPPKVATAGEAKEPPTRLEQAEVRYRYKQTMLRYIFKIFELSQGNQITTQQLTMLGQPLEEEVIGGPPTERGEEEEDF